MKEGWQILKIGDCFNGIKNGASILQKKGASGIPITRIETLSNSVFNRDRLGYADITSADKYSSYILNEGDILMSHINSLAYIGRAVQYHKQGDEVIIHGMNLLRLVPIQSIVLPSYAEYYFKTDAFRWNIQRIANVSIHQASFNTKALKALDIIVPPLSEQQRIVNLLDAEFAKIDALKANAEKNLQNAKDLFQAALKKELEPKEGWKKTTIGGVSNGSDNIKWKLIDASIKYKYIDLTSVDRSFHRITEPQVITAQDAPSRAQRIVKCNDVIFATTRPTLRRLCIIPQEFDGDICSTGFCVLRPHSSVLPKWLYYNLSVESFYEYIEPLQTGATYPAVTDSDIRNYTIYLPTIEDQQSIVARLDALKEKCKTLQTNYEKTLSLCDDLKQALLRKAFNGEI